MFYFKKITIGIAALLVVGAIAQEFPIAADAPWREVKDGEQRVYEINYLGKNWPSLKFSPAIAPKCYYRVSWDIKNSVPDKEVLFTCAISLGGKNGQNKYPVTPEWSTCTFYFYSGATDKVDLRLSCNPGTEQNFAVRNIKIAELTPEELAGNLFPDNDFENNCAFPVAWGKSWGTPINPCSIVGAQGFVSGEKSLQVDFSAKFGIQCIQMPVVLGKDYELRFWAKAEKEHVIKVSVQAWSRFEHKGGHFYKFLTCKITPEWKEYTVRLNVSEDIDKYPDLAEHLMFVGIYNDKEETGKIWFDDFSFGQSVEK